MGGPPSVEVVEDILRPNEAVEVDTGGGAPPRALPSCCERSDDDEDPPGAAPPRAGPFVNPSAEPLGGVGDGLVDDVVVDPLEALATCRRGPAAAPAVLIAVGRTWTPPALDEYDPDGLLSVLRKSKSAGGAVAPGVAVAVVAAVATPEAAAAVVAAPVTAGVAMPFPAPPLRVGNAVVVK